jgi:CheY-like chemotaxis protein
VDADSRQLQQLIMTLVLNAAEAIGDAIGTVQVTTGVEPVGAGRVPASPLAAELVPGRYLFLEVCDSGCGMDEETSSRIFDPFFTTKFTGRGLGLAAALGIVRGHKGDIEVRSVPERGSTFRVLLPAAAGQSDQEEAAAGPEDLRGNGTILLVDDEEIVARTGKAALERYGYRVLSAGDGLQAVEMFREQRDEIDLVLLDMTMPILSGEETFAHLADLRPGVRVIVSSGYNEVEAARRFSGPGVAAFIQKPYTAVQLAEKVKEVLEGRGRGLASGSVA